MDYNYPLFVISSTAKVSKNLKKKNIFSSDSTSSESDDEGIAFQTGNDKRRQPVPRNKKLAGSMSELERRRRNTRDVPIRRTRYY